MTALAANRFLADKGPHSRVDSYPLADNVHIYKGSLVSFHAGYLVPAADTSGDICVGIAEEEVDNTTSGHTAGRYSCRVRSGTRVLALPCSGMAQSNVGAEVYVLDSATVALTGGVTNHVHVGTIVFYNSATSVDVYMPPCGQGA